MWGNRRFLPHLSAAPLRGAILWRSREVGRGMPGREIPPGQNYERVKGARMPAQPPGVARELIPPQGVWLIY